MRDRVRNGELPDVKVGKVLGVANKLFGLKSAFDHSSAAINNFKDGDNYSGTMNLLKVGLDVGLICAKSNPLIFTLSTAYQIYDTSGYMNYHLKIK